MIKRPTWILLIILVLAIAGYFFIKNRPAKEPEATPYAAGFTYLIDQSLGRINKIHISDAQRNVVRMERNVDGNWMISLPNAGQADQGLAEAAESQLFALRVLSTLETSPPLEDVGLNPPQYLISLVFTDDTYRVINIGGPTPTGSGYYVQYEDEIHVVSLSAIDAVLELLKNPPYLATETPTLNPATETPTLSLETPLAGATEISTPTP